MIALHCTDWLLQHTWEKNGNISRRLQRLDKLSRKLQLAGESLALWGCTELNANISSLAGIMYTMFTVFM